MCWSCRSTRGSADRKFIPGAVHKIRKLAELREQHRLNYRIEVDGGVALDTVAEVVRAGAEILVAGNAVSVKAIQQVTRKNC